MDQASWGGDPQEYKGIKREKVIDWVIGYTMMDHGIAAAMVDNEPFYYECMFDQYFEITPS